MKILVVNNLTPFGWGGAEELAVNLVMQLEKSGQQAELLRIPFTWEPVERIPQQMLLVRALELWNVDRVIALKFPAYLIRHPYKTLWLVHQYRQAYDLYDAGQSNLTPDAKGDALRQLIVNADNEAFQDAQALYTIGPVISHRLAKYNGVTGVPMVVPLNDPELFTGGASQGYIFAGGRINLAKRQHLLVEAMTRASESVKLVIAGPPETLGDATRLEELVEKYDLSDRVTLDLGFLPRRKVADYVNGAAACASLPFNEDSYSYVAMEAASAGKAVITTSDSGGVLDLVKHGQNGWVCEPTPQSLAEVLTWAVEKPKPTQQMGSAAREIWAQLDVTWPRIVERLLA